MKRRDERKPKPTPRRAPSTGRAPSLDASDFAKPVKKAAPEPAEEAAETDEPDESDEADEGGEAGPGPGPGPGTGPGTGTGSGTGTRRDMGPLISSRKNARIHLARALATRRGRKREGKFLIEGVKVIKELLARAVAIELVLWKDGLEQRPDAKALLADLRARGIEAFGVAPPLFDELVDTESSQGLLAIAPTRWGSLEDALGPEGSSDPRALVVAAGVQDPGNLGTIVRSARFLGFAGVACLSGTTDPWAPKVVRASSGALIDSPPVRVESLAELTEKARARGFKTVALSPRGGKPLEKTTLPARSVLLLGAEGPGLTVSAVEGADEHVSLAASDPAAESLNAAMAFAIFAYAWRAAHAAPPSG